MQPAHADAILTRDEVATCSRHRALRRVARGGRGIDLALQSRHCGLAIRYTLSSPVLCDIAGPVVGMFVRRPARRRSWQSTCPPGWKVPVPFRSRRSPLPPLFRRGSSDLPRPWRVGVRRH